MADVSVFESTTKKFRCESGGLVTCYCCILSAGSFSRMVLKLTWEVSAHRRGIWGQGYTNTNAGEKETCYGTMQRDEPFALCPVGIGLRVTAYSSSPITAKNCRSWRDVQTVVSSPGTRRAGVDKAGWTTYLVCGGWSCHCRRRCIAGTEVNKIGSGAPLPPVRLQLNMWFLSGSSRDNHMELSTCLSRGLLINVWTLTLDA